MLTENLECVELLLAAGALRESMLMARSAEITQMLITAGAPLDAQDAQGRTALMSAVAHLSVPTIRVLLQAGANPNLSDQSGRTALSFAASGCSASGGACKVR